MRKIKVSLVFLLFIAPFLSFTPHVINSGDSPGYGGDRAIVIEDFDSGIIDLESYPNEDEDPQDWELNSNITYENSPWSLRLFGNTWKIQNIQPIVIDTGEVWQVSAYIASPAEIQGFAIMDASNVLFYSFAGTETANVEEWATVYQGNFPEDQWNIYQLPVADDWLAYFDYLPEIISLVYINDKDETSQGVVYFDHIINITKDLPEAPEVSIDFTIVADYKAGNGNRMIDVQFYGEVEDPDSNEHDFYWDFGDESTSTEQNPVHAFLVSDEHPYTVLLEVVDETNQWGRASCSIEVDPGNSSFPITMNFVGDIMMARRYENFGGIIPTEGVEAIYEPIKAFLGDAADITVANLECPLTTYGQHHPTKRVYFKSSPNNIDGLTYAGIDIVTLANNHITDYLEPGMEETQSVLVENGIIYFGAGTNSYEAYQPAFYSKSGVNFAFLGASNRTGQYNNYQPYLDAGYNKPGFANLLPYYIKKQIDEVRDVSDLVVMEWHAGVEYSFAPSVAAAGTVGYEGEIEDKVEVEVEVEGDEGYSPLADSPSTRDREIRHFAIDNGADLVICHHPHIVQGVEVYSGKLIAHSLGDFVFDLNYPETYYTMILNTKVDETGFYEFTIIPVYIDDYIPLRAEGELGLYILDDIVRHSKDLDTYLFVDRVEVMATVIMDTLSMEFSQKEFIADLALEEFNSNLETIPHRIKKEGSISSVNSIQPAGVYEFRLGREEIWWGNMEDEGCTLWNLNNTNETYCDTVAFEGKRSVQHIREAGSPSNLVTNFDEWIICLGDSMNYSLAGYIKTQNGANVSIEVRYYDDRPDGNLLGQENVGASVNGDTPWTFYHQSLTIPSGTRFCDIRLNSGVPNTGIAYSWFDNVSLVQWTDWDDYDILQAIPAPNDFYFIQVRSTQSIDEIVLNYSETVFEELHVGMDEATDDFSNDDQLKQNWPNPFNPGVGSTSISFDLERSAKVKIIVYNIKGQQVKVLTDTDFQPGGHTVYWDGCDSGGQHLSSGLYFYQLETQNRKQVKKCMLVRY